jgi:hypothetical protein
LAWDSLIFSSELKSGEAASAAGSSVLGFPQLQDHSQVQSKQLPQGGNTPETYAGFDAGFCDSVTWPHSGQRPGEARRSYPQEMQRPRVFRQRRRWARRTIGQIAKKGAIAVTAANDQIGAMKL